MMGTLWLPAGCNPLPGQRVDWHRMGLPRPVGEWWLNEGSGALVNDASGNGNHGTLTNMDPATDWVGTPYGVALDFDGSDDYVRAPRDPRITSTSHFTFSALCKLKTAGTLKVLACIDDGTNHIFFMSTGTNYGMNGVYVRGLSLNNTTVASTDAATLEWHRWTVTFNGAALALYMDGINVPLKDGSALSVVTKTDEVRFCRIGENTLSGAWQILQSQLWPTALTASQVQALQGPVPIWVPRRYFDLAGGGATVTATRALSYATLLPATGLRASAYAATQATQRQRDTAYAAIQAASAERLGQYATTLPASAAKETAYAARRGGVEAVLQAAYAVTQQAQASVATDYATALAVAQEALLSYGVTEATEAAAATAYATLAPVQHELSAAYSTALPVAVELLTAYSTGLEVVVIAEALAFYATTLQVSRTLPAAYATTRPASAEVATAYAVLQTVFAEIETMYGTDVATITLTAAVLLLLMANQPID
jgi:hypothetical protein